MPQSEDDSFGGRFRRYARVGTAMSGLAARVAGERYLGMRIDRDRHAGELVQALGGLRGPLMKVAQILATIPDALPKEYVDQLKQLQSNAPPMGWPFVRRRMQAELGNGWEARFAGFDREAAHAASLGQVHRARGQDGRLLACKLQYPNMSSAVEADLRQLRLIFSIYHRYDNAIRTEQIHAELADRLREELDYRRELKNMQLYRLMLEDVPTVEVPEPVEELSTGRLLTMTWLQGRPLMEFVGAPVELRNQIAYNMFQAWYVPFYRYGVIHGDPHLGNYSVRDDAGINLLDFGSIRVFRPAFVQGVIDLYRALRDEDEELAVQAYREWGFDNLNKEMIGVLNQWARFVYGPLLEDRVRPIQEVRTGQQGAQVAGRVRADLQRVGGVSVPREFVLMDRAAIGLGSVFMHLKAEINWYQVFNDLVDDFHADALAERQQRALEAVQMPPAAATHMPAAYPSAG